MKERPILFNTQMVQAILEGRKTQTRRVIKPQPEWVERKPNSLSSAGWSYNTKKLILRHYPVKENFCISLAKYGCHYGKIGDRLWVRETFAPYDDGIRKYQYRADWGFIDDTDNRDFNWKPSIFMPRAASRITLEITNIRVERLNDISQGDAQDEGCEGQIDGGLITPVDAYKTLWQSINGKGSWDLNPWVWVVEFKKI